MKRPTAGTIRDVMGLLGLAGITASAWLIYPPCAPGVAGVVLLAVVTIGYLQGNKR
jgi:hypothetical protein